MKMKKLTARMNISQTMVLNFDAILLPVLIVSSKLEPDGHFTKSMYLNFAS